MVVAHKKHARVKNATGATKTGNDEIRRKTKSNVNYGLFALVLCRFGQSRCTSRGIRTVGVLTAGLDTDGGV